MQYSSHVMTAIQAVVERHFGSWRAVEGTSSIFSLKRQTMGFASGPERNACFDTGDEVFDNKKAPDLFVTEREEAEIAPKLRRWPAVGLLRLADFIDFVSPALKVPGKADTGPSLVLDRLPSVARNGGFKPVVELCVAQLLQLGDARRSTPILIVGGRRSGKTTVLTKIARRAWEATGMTPFRVGLPARDEDISEDMLVRASIGACLQLADQHLLELAPYVSDRTLILVDDVRGDSKTFIRAANYAAKLGLRVVAAVDHTAADCSPPGWDRYTIDALSSREVAALIRESVTHEGSRTYYPSHRLTRCVANIEDASDLRKALRDALTDRAAEPALIEIEVAARVLEKAIKRIARRAAVRDNSPDDVEDAIKEAVGCNALECTLRRTDRLSRMESTWLNLSNIVRLVDQPRPMPAGLAHVFDAASFLEGKKGDGIEEESLAWRSSLLCRAALAAFIAARLGAEGVVALRWPVEIPLPESQVDLLGGKGLICPLLGAIRFDAELVAMVANALSRLDMPSRRRAEEVLVRIVENCRCSAFYTLWPWRFAGGNALTLLGHLRGGRLAGDFSGCRLDGAWLSGLDLSEATFCGSLLTGACLERTKVASKSLEFCYLDKTLLDPELRTALAAPGFPSVGLDGRIDISSRWLSPPSGMRLQTPGRGLAPFAISEAVTRLAYLDFTLRNPGFGKTAYIERCQQNRPEDFDRYYLWDWPDGDAPGGADLDKPIAYVGRDAAIAYAADRGARLISCAEWQSCAPHDGSLHNFSEWIWDEAVSETGGAMSPRAFSAQPTEGWLGLVGNCGKGVASTARIKSTNANDDVTFRLVVDFVQIAQGAL
jgi:hypothetical protein